MFGYNYNHKQECANIISFSYFFIFFLLQIATDHKSRFDELSCELFYKIDLNNVFILLFIVRSYNDNLSSRHDTFHDAYTSSRLLYRIACPRVSTPLCPERGTFGAEVSGHW